MEKPAVIIPMSVAIDMGLVLDESEWRLDPVRDWYVYKPKKEDDSKESK